MIDHAEETIGVLVMSYGTPESLDQIEAYYTHIRRGRPPSPEQLQELTHRYKSIVGGVFPLRENTNKQVAALEEALKKSPSPFKFSCYQGLRHASPFIEDGVQQMAADGIKRAVGIVLTPHYSSMSVGAYIERAKKAAEENGIRMDFVESYHLHPQFIEALVERVRNTLQQFDEHVRNDVKVLFTAHSLPEKILEMNDPYVDQLHQSSQAVADRAEVSNWQFAWQSAGQTPMPWLGPDIADVLRDLAKDGVKHVLVCPIGFVSDHLEVLYDIDIECQQVAKEVGIELKRTPSLNTDAKYIQTLADCILEKLYNSQSN